MFTFNICLEISILSLERGAWVRIPKNVQHVTFNSNVKVPLDNSISDKKYGTGHVILEPARDELPRIAHSETKNFRSEIEISRTMKLILRVRQKNIAVQCPHNIVEIKSLTKQNIHVCQKCVLLVYIMTLMTLASIPLSPLHIT